LNFSQAFDFFPNSAELGNYASNQCPVGWTHAKLMKPLWKFGFKSVTVGR